MESTYDQTDGISEYWRLNRSGFEAVELANVPRAMRKVAGHLGANVGRIEYTGMSRGRGAGIILEPSVLMGRYPVPPEKVDQLVGLVIGETVVTLNFVVRDEEEGGDVTRQGADHLRG
jgi:hypothetical protein